MNRGGKDAASNDACRKTHGQQLAVAVKWIALPTLFTDIEVHGNTKWQVIHLVQVAVLWVWSSQRKMVEAAAEAIADAKELFQVEHINSYQTLLNGLKRYSDTILAALCPRLRQLMHQVDESGFRVGLWLALAVDGSRISTCRTLPNEKRFCKPKSCFTKKKRRKAKKRGRTATKRKPVTKKTHYNPQPVGPQVWLTLLWHVGLQMPWAWKIGPSYSSERHHFQELLNSLEFPEYTLICGDAGFVGYDFWKAIEEADLRFLIRVGSNCSFLKKLGRVREREGIVYCWPKEKQKCKQPPLMLRLMRFHDGKSEIYLVTNELCQRRLSDSQCQTIYRKRWGVELQFRALKQTYNRSKLLGRTPDVVEQELTWSLVGLWMMQLIARRDQVDVIEPGTQTSIALVLAIIQRILRRPNTTSPRGESFRNQMSQAVTDNYQRLGRKKSRNYPRHKEQPRSSPPIVTQATAAQKRLDKKIATGELLRAA
ncbi:MAG: IS4 family transposase [Planctomycetales bacterium]|nr:IS4 family transposase [Planctomycetales bacterium]